MIRKCATTFTNPIVTGGNHGSADPWVIYKDGFYYYCRSLDGTAIGISKTKRLQDIGVAKMVKVFEPDPEDAEQVAYSKEIWAPELHYLRGKWYIYFAADDGNNDNHRMYVLESDSQDPQGSYTFKGKLSPQTERWAIDGTVLEYDDNLYFIWSGWPGFENEQQNLYIAAMSNPYTITGDRVLLSEPTEPWEKYTYPGGPIVNEGPQILKKDGTVHIIYSASHCSTNEYCLGMITFNGTSADDIMNPSKWVKKTDGPVFQKNSSTGVFGPGHASFVQSPDNSESWILYHAYSSENSPHEWTERTVRAQRFDWKGTEPIFGIPVALGVEITEPSGTCTD